MKADPEAIAELVDRSYIVACERRFGKAGRDGLRLLLRDVRRLLVHLPPSFVERRLLILYEIESGVPLPEVIAELSSSDLSHLLALQQAYAELAIVIRGGTYTICRAGGLDAFVVSQNAILYQLLSDRESFYVGGKEFEVPSLFPGFRSVFASPTFEDLDRALSAYRDEFIGTARCPIFQTAWSSSRRLLFVNRPEARLRSSLETFLASSLEGVDEVRPEQNVDETGPIDIRVTWSHARHVALVEIKWMGDSLSAAGSEISMHYRDARANEGARQLADYLDRHKSRTGRQITVGYLVVVDGRRRGVTAESTSIGPENGLYYRLQEVTYDPPYHELRRDFRPPIRMFCPPVVDLEERAVGDA